MLIKLSSEKGRISANTSSQSTFCDGAHFPAVPDRDHLYRT
jgi:hypothetical protein